MDNCSQNSKRVLPNTPRVSDKIMEYYQKFGHNRDLEKFMRLYSPASSQDSQKTQTGEREVNTIDSCCKRTKSRETIPSSNSCEALAKIPCRPLGIATNSKSLPNIDIQGQTAGDARQYFHSNDVIVDINIEKEAKKEKILSISTENLETPKKTYKNSTTQTPESVAKSHRRLEWDSLGDIGYTKSMSTSNISIMERSLLKEFFKESSVISEPDTSATIQKQQHIIEEHKTIKKIKHHESEHTTPPLACSTLVEPKTKKGAKSKMITQSTSSTSLQEKFNKSVQTSLINLPVVRSQEIQCSMSSSNSIIEGTATPSSFEYYSSRSSSKSSDLLQKIVKPLEHPFITNITDLLMKRKALSEKNQQKHNKFSNIRELQTKFLAALDENKENQSHSTIDSSSVNSISLSKQAPELDLGIQLICSLIDAKSVNGRHKKQLIRDIVKRITHLDVGEQISSPILGTINSTSTNSSAGSHHHIYDSVPSIVSNKHNQGNLAKLKSPSEFCVIPITMEQSNTEEVVEKPSLVTKKPNNENDKLNSFESSKSLPSQLANEGHHKQMPSRTKQQCKNENNTNVSSVVVAATINKEPQSELITTKKSKERGQLDSKQSPDILKTKLSTIPVEKISKTTISSSTSATTTPDLTTQKFIASTNNINNELNNSNTDAEQPTMREWLNPLTQSEIEYEEKKRKEMKKKTAAVQREKLLKKSKEDYGRMQQLSWIENEIKRLECLKHLLLNDERREKRSSVTESSLGCSRVSKDSIQSDKLYDTVYSDKSSVLSESAERLVKEIEIILEESHEDVINLQDNLKSTKDRKKEIQILYEKEEDSSKENCKKAKAKFRSVKESINFSEEQLLNQTESELDHKPRRQREKIDTPSTEKSSQESESLKDLVKQRKKEFMESYKTKKQHHYEALKQQQQKEDYNYLNIQRKMHENRSTTTDSEHYSVPHTLPGNYNSNDVSYAYTQHPLPSTPVPREAKFKTLNPRRTNIIYSTAAIGIAKPEITHTTTANSTTTTTTSSSSIFCMSSEVSVPMGSQNISSTPTTTHQYDDVAAAATAVTTGIAVQTSDSILRSKPIYGPQRSQSTLKPSTTTSSTIPVCIQVKPKGIAYVIEFDDTTTSNADINSNELHIKSTAKTTDSTSTEPPLTLQEHLEKSKPKFLQQFKKRKAILNKLQSMRQERDRQLREIIDNASFNSLDRRLQYLPPPPIQKVRISNTKDMKALTNKRVSNLPEVVAKQEREIEEKNRRSNRILRDIFNRRLQKRVRSGKLSLNHSKTVI